MDRSLTVNGMNILLASCNVTLRSARANGVGAHGGLIPWAPVCAGIAQPRHGRLRGYLEQVEPVGLDRLAQRPGIGRAEPSDRPARPGERLAGFVVATLADQPARRFRQPIAGPAARSAMAPARSQEQQAPLAGAHEGAGDAAEADAQRDHAGHQTPTQPRLRLGMNSCTSGRSTQ